MKFGTRPAAQAQEPAKPIALVLSPDCGHCRATVLDLYDDGLLDAVPTYTIGKDPEAEEYRRAINAGGYPFMITHSPANGPRVIMGRQPIVAAVREWARR